jgi:DnaA family protein
MKQLALDIALVTGPTLDNFFAGPNEAALRHLRLWAGSAGSSPAAVRRSPVPIYLWGGPASGKTHLLRAVQGELLNQDASVGWLDSTVLEPPPFQETWRVVLIDDVQLFTAAQQHAAFNWFVNAQSHQCGVLGG